MSETTLYTQPAVRHGKALAMANLFVASIIAGRLSTRLMTTDPVATRRQIESIDPRIVLTDHKVHPNCTALTGALRDDNSA